MFHVLLQATKSILIDDHYIFWFYNEDNEGYWQMNIIVLSQLCCLQYNQYNQY